MSKRLKICFTISILLNVLLMGGAAGVGYQMMADHSWHDIDMSPQTRSLMKSAFEEKRKKIKVVMQKIHDHRDKLQALIVAPEFDPVAFDVAMREWVVFNNNVTDGKVTFVSNLLTQLSQEERRKVSEKFVDILTGNKKHKSHRSGDRKHNESKRDQSKDAPEVAE